MQLDRPALVKLAGFGGITAVALAANQLGLGEHSEGLLAGLVALAGEGARAVWGHLGVHLIERVAGHSGAEEHARGTQNHDLHRLMGETIAGILEREAEGAPGGRFGGDYLKRAANAFRRNEWMEVELVGPEIAVGETKVPAYFKGDAESIKKAAVLEPAEWFALVEKVAGPATFAEYEEQGGLALGRARQALEYAANKLREHFAFELWETAKHAWQTGDLAWPALILRLLSLIVGYAGDSAVNSVATVRQLTELRTEVRTLSSAISGVAAEGTARLTPDQIPAQKEMVEAIRAYQYDLNLRLVRIDERILELQQEVRGGFAQVLLKVAEIKDAITGQLGFSRSPTEARVRDYLLTKVETEWVHDRLNQGLRKAIRVDLKLTETLEAVRPGLRIHTITESGPPGERPIDDNIQAIFEQADGRLLILGEPGTGKTNLLMELAEGLIARARRDEKLPIPVLFSLPRWTQGGRERTLMQWLIDDLDDDSQYGLGREPAAALVLQNLITPLLDGLDEVAEERRAACVEAIHAYQRQRGHGKLVICCRLEEYASLPRLNLRVAIRVEKLTPGEVGRFLANVGLEQARRTLEGDQELLEIIDTPLWLHVAILAAQAKPPARIQTLSPRDRLYARFVEYALHREADDSPRRRTATEDFKNWLGWLAAAMRRRSQREFAFEELSYSWVGREGVLHFLVRLPIALIGVMFGLLLGISSGMLPAGLAYGLFLGWTCFSVEDLPTEELYLAWKFWWAALGMALIFGFPIFFIVASFGCGLYAAEFAGLIAGLSVGMVDILRPVQLRRRMSPNRGTLRAIRHGARFLLVSGLTLGISFAMFLPLQIALGISAYLTFIFAWENGVGFATRHYIVRLILHRKGVAPLRYVDFLNEASERLFLARRGGSYEFFHLTFRDYMADTYGSIRPKRRLTESQHSTSDHALSSIAREANDERGH